MSKIAIIAADDYKALSAALTNREDIIVTGDSHMLHINGTMYTLRNASKKPVTNVAEEYILIKKKQSKLSNKERKRVLKSFFSYYKLQ